MPQFLVLLTTDPESLATPQSIKKGIEEIFDGLTVNEVHVINEDENSDSLPIWFDTVRGARV